MYIGADAALITGGESTFDNAGMPRSLPMRLLPRLSIGATHFWGHADFYVAFPIPPDGSAIASDGLSSMVSTGIETGARLYPLQLRRGAPRPFVGASWNVMHLAQMDTGGRWGAAAYRHRALLQAGAAWLLGPGMLEGGVGWLPASETLYPAPGGEAAEVSLLGALGWIGYKVLFDVTLPAEYAGRRGALERIERHMDTSGQLSTFTLAAGPSTAFSSTASPLITEELPALDALPPSSIFADVAIGYYFHRIDAAAAVSYRGITQRQRAYGTELHATRRTASLEAYKFLFDYHGFVPFIGATFGYEYLTATLEQPGSPPQNGRAAVWRPGLIFGWDIRPTPVDWFVLRTNLRYTPGLAVAPALRAPLRLDQLEFNFIQFVFYPARFFDL